MADHSQPAPDWRPIDSAPRDGSYILAACFKSGELLWACKSRWLTAEEAQASWPETELSEDDFEQGWTDGVNEDEPAYPTHWLPLPPAPEPNV